MNPSNSLDQPFGYRCNGCGHCCTHVLVTVNDDEAGRLAACLGEPVEAVLERRTIRRGGVRVLRQGADGRCVFRSDEGCAVYADRPLACRLYPLAPAGDGWRIPPPDPMSRADYDGGGTVGDYLRRQAVAPYLAAIRPAPGP